MSRLRCAIYTRKSTEEGLEQDFNSLDAQREACEAYIRSQAGEGWQPIRSRYDDGGFSGGTLDRPALQRLLVDITARKVDVIVVYKVDRLTRSLADFAKIVEVFDAHGVSFVSVTQQFNTTTSMGRLTLNMLLSFAQFEREVTGERIRDKIAASKRKGMWMGGVVPLGYEVVDRKLVVNDAQAKTVRRLFQLYLEQEAVAGLQREAHRLHLRSKARAPFTRGHLYRLLSNPIYIGEISHKGERHPGEHEAIIDRATWDAVQAQLKRNAVRRHHSSNANDPSLLKGLLHDSEGRPMKPSHATKSGKRYRYYISLQPEDSPSEACWRLPAAELEGAVVTAVGSFLGDRRRLIDALDLSGLPAHGLKAMLSKASKLSLQLRNAGRGEQCEVVRSLIDRVEVQRDRLGITLLAEPLRILLGEEIDQEKTSDVNTVSLDVPVTFRRRGVETKLVLGEEGTGRPCPDPNLIAVVAQGHRWFEELRTGEAPSVADLVNRHGVDQGDVSRALPFAFLAPDVVEAIFAGRQPVELTAARLKRMRLPLSWVAQRRQLGFDG